jgi:hypothetical protein
MWQALSPKGVIPASVARKESFLKQRKIPDKPDLRSRKSLKLRRKYLKIQ